MRVSVRQLRQIIHESLGGPPNTSGLAVCTKAGDRSISAVIYSTRDFINVTQKESGEWKHFANVAISLIKNNVVKGYISLMKTKNPCNDAWMVDGVAGQGKIIYGIGYVLSPSGIIMPDRMSVSQYAQAAWSRVSSSSRPRYPLDDIDAEPQDRLTPNDTSDDCRLQTRLKDGGPNPVLDYAYGEEGWEEDVLARLEANHDKVMEMISSINPGEMQDKITRGLMDAGNDFFIKSLKSKNY